MRQIHPLYPAVRRGHTDAVRLLLERGACIDWVDDDGWTYLHYTSIDNATDVAKVLLDYDIEIDIKTYNKRTPLHVAACHGCYDMAKLLIDHGANINSLNTYECTPLDDALERIDDTGMIDLLRAHGAISNKH